LNVRVIPSGANDWTHRQFVEAGASTPEAVASALSYIGRLYTVEVEIEPKQPSGENKLEYRLGHSQPVIAIFMQQCELQCQTGSLLPGNPLRKGINCTLKRTNALKVFWMSRLAPTIWKGRCAQYRWVVVTGHFAGPKLVPHTLVLSTA